MKCLIGKGRKKQYAEQEEDRIGVFGPKGFALLYHCLIVQLHDT
jgi:hypothetical protein